MKAELSLPERPSVLYLLAVFDILLVLLIFFTLIPQVAQQAGTMVERAETASRLPAMENSISLWAKPGPQPVLRLGTKRVSLKNLPEALENAKDSERIEAVIFFPDQGLTEGVMSKIREAVFEADLLLAQGGMFPVEDPSDEPRNR